MQEIFHHDYDCDMEKSLISLEELQQKLNIAGEELGMKIQAQHEDIFTYMHRI